ncbi:hypothetical protein TOPH_05682 [Tolypocladium ophioglossoides CBS 100239]|uniref:Uncharacterized protein n=1 Tax=Tolypocladium ophioglossoides (strain CBS 100239) TaxID=1163406 RepID=A0A0L0N6K4_TOLOC|nr:hypothetical protein TOPH_05682 [Tolypocladium ophioglossoides CBS 100239]
MTTALRQRKQAACSLGVLSNDKSFTITPLFDDAATLPKPASRPWLAHRTHRLGVSNVNCAPSHPSNNSSSDEATTIASADSNPIANLAVTLQQTSTSPPTVRVSVANNNDHEVTILSYLSPLDQLALPLGLLSITPAGSRGAA